MDVTKYIRSEILEMEEYKTVPSFWDLEEDFLKLDAGENPYGFSPKINKALADYEYFNYYPDPEYKELRKALANYAGVNMENIMVGSGSDELLDLTFRLFLNSGDKVINCPPSFGMYPILVTLNKGELISVPRNKDFSLDLKSIKEKIEKAKVIIICNPNNPTGNVSSKEEIISLLKSGKIVIVDEAYFEYYGESVVSQVKKYNNLIVLRTLSKWAGIAGLRLGYAIASPFIVKQLLKIKSPYNVNLAAEVAGKIALSNLSQANFINLKIVKERERVFNQLQKISYLNVYPSKTNFLFVKFNEDLLEFKTYLEKNKIAVRFYDSDLTGKAIRISIGKPEQNNKVIKILKRYKYQKINKYAFLDRDGTLIFEPQDTFQIDSVKKLKILDGVIRGLKKLKGLGYELIIVTNQDGLGTTSFLLANFQEVQNKMLNIFERNGIKFKKIFICPHLPSENCNCRKPKIGLVKNFLTENQIDKSNSFVIGDRKTDKLFAENLQVKFIPMQTNGDFYKALMEGETI